MSSEDLMNQSCVIYPKSGYTHDGRSSFGSGVTTVCRAQQTTIRKLLPTGNLVEISLILYVPPDTTVENDYKVTFGGSDYKVFSKYSAIGFDGSAEHIKLEGVKWQAT